MVIAKAEWFKNKNSNPSIFNMPWKGLVYIIIAGSVIFLGVFLPSNIITSLLIAGIFLFMIFDANISVFRTMDEREKMHYSITMMNVAWEMLITIILVSIILSYLKVENSLEILILATGTVGGLINIITSKKLEREN